MLRTRRAPVGARSALLGLTLLVGTLGVVGPAAAAAPLPTHVHGHAEPGPIEALAGREYQRECRPEPQPGVEAFRDFVLAAHPGRDGGIVRACDVGGRSEHKEGRGWDWMLDASDPVEAAAADQVLDWLLATDAEGNEFAMARRLGVMYVIWDRQIWSASRARDGWRPYTGTSPHTDHVHVSFSWAGARQETSYWQLLPDPPVTRLLAALSGDRGPAVMAVLATSALVLAARRRRGDEPQTERSSSGPSGGATR
ncbi:hypothetical protein [Egicoccus halophilus]|uniref:ARB-07466-like C-terminal domain-containing protein n=1 Tax=Egicoccus halophilus TaxID=1670830 RepID=A0A8J3AF33_9ACTN|nr:hypothetical protein [Egicoccus halophilus]GGI06923.1 hypothetical protein GCM10011354_21520 [Egicoccus halophilus]